MLKDDPELVDESTKKIVQQTETTTATTTSDSSEEPVQTRRSRSSEISKNEKLNGYVTFEEKEKVVQFANAHPDYTLEQIKIETGCQKLIHKKRLKLWKKHVASGGSLVDKKTRIEKFIHSKCIENDEDITFQQIKIWVDKAKETYQLKDLKFNASDRWILRFINTHGITNVKRH